MRRAAPSPAGQEQHHQPSRALQVLSPSTEAYDRGAKWAYYRQLDSLQEYILVSQDKPLVEHYVRQEDGSWKFTATGGLEGAITLPSLGCVLPLAEAYDRVTFAESVTDEEAADVQ